MGLPAALKAHAQKDLKLAALHYQRAIDQKKYKPVLFQNYGALLREAGDLKKSRSVYELGLKLFPRHLPILRNYANLLRDIDEFLSLTAYFDLLHNKIHLASNDLVEEDFLPIIEILQSLGCHSWAYEISYFAISLIGLYPGLAVQCLKTFAYHQDSLNSVIDKESLENLFAVNISYLSEMRQSEFFYALSWMYFQDKDIEMATNYLSKARKIISNADNLSHEDLVSAIELNDRTSWNAATILLNTQNFELGWQLFEHGLRVAAKGPQAWQRALPKPFTHNQLALWRGESLNSRRLLLLEEQAIGDVMQFMTLLPNLIDEASHIGILINKRLLQIYKRSFSNYINDGRVSIWSFGDVRTSKLLSSNFDYQSPIGSICQYRFTHPKSYAPKSPFLLVDRQEVSKIKEKYLDSQTPRSSKIIGISWRGGGTSSRIKQKSINPNFFSQLINKFPQHVFVSLQYGDVAQDISNWKKSGVNVLHDSNFDAIQSLEKWLIQVASCDAVISVANTTIHGSGGLGVPTMCLLSLHNDWRWLSDPSIDQSYWYPSVGIIRETSDSGWSEAFVKLTEWIASDCPLSWSRPYNV